MNCRPASNERPHGWQNSGHGGVWLDRQGENRNEQVGGGGNAPQGVSRHSRLHAVHHRHESLGLYDRDRIATSIRRASTPARSGAVNGLISHLPIDRPRIRPVSPNHFAPAAPESRHDSSVRNRAAPLVPGSIVALTQSMDSPLQGDRTPARCALGIPAHNSEIGDARLPYRAGSSAATKLRMLARIT
jgi:hypothetical protein